MDGTGVIDYFYTDDGHHFVKHTHGHFNERGAGLVNIIFGHFDPHSLIIIRDILILTLSILIGVYFLQTVCLKLSSFRVLRQYSATNSVLTLASEIHIFRHMPSNLEISLGQRFCTPGPRSAKSLALGVQNPRPREIGPRGYISQYIPPIGSVKFHHLWHFAILGTGWQILFLASG